MSKKDLPVVDLVERDFGEIKLSVTQSVGPRILSLRYRDSDNILAELPGDFLEFSRDEKFYFYGGHRLWVSPEIPAVTYSPDNLPVNINQSGGLS